MIAKIKQISIPEVQKIGVYAIRNKANNKYYIGSSVNVYNRLKQQKSNIINYGLNLKLINDMKDKNFDLEFLIIETFEDGEITDQQLREKELFYIKKYNSIENGYNTNIPFATGKFDGLLQCRKTEINKHIKQSYDKIYLRLPKGTRDRIKALTEESHNDFIVKAVIEKIESMES